MCIYTIIVKDYFLKVKGKQMKLLTKEKISKLPKLYEQEDKGLNAIAYVKFFTPWSNWTWYATEYSDGMFFGLVDGLVKELGYFSLEELESIKGPFGLRIERDLYFQPAKLKNLM
jgi:hypothetical protein